MRRLFYKYLASVSKRVGFWFFRLMAWGISTGYFFFIPKRTKISVDFYKALFPEKFFFTHLKCSWKQYHNFTNVFVDRSILHASGDISYTSEGWEHIENAIDRTGGIILMSHIGNWEVAAHLLRDRGMRMLLYMGIKEKEQIERTQKESLEERGLKIIAVKRDELSPFDIVEGVNFLKGGGLVSLTGDRLWRDDQRSVDVDFLGHSARLPETPYIFAMLSGAPLLFFFAFRTGSKRYHFRILPPVYVRAESRSGRKEAFRRTAQQYADRMQETLREYPYDWFHFERFLIKK